MTLAIERIGGNMNLWNQLNARRAVKASIKEAKSRNEAALLAHKEAEEIASLLSQENLKNHFAERFIAALTTPETKPQCMTH